MSNPGTTIEIKQADASEAAPEVQVESVAALAESKVLVAEIQADRDVAVAEIAAEVAVAHIEAEEAAEDDNTQQRLDECQRNIETIQSAQAEQSSLLLLILERLSEQLPPTPPPAEESVALMPDNQEASVPQAPKPKPQKYRLI
jgi:hypothetical protein